MPSYSVVTFGCQMNMHDSERISDVLRGAGYELAAGPEVADLILLNTCSVREKAEQKLRSEVGRLGVLKRKNPNLVIGIAGCVAQQEGERLLRTMPQVDLVVGPDNIPELPELLRGASLGAPPQVRTVFDYDHPSFLAVGSTERAGPTAFVTTMKGCDERCTFCIVPFTRGAERYRPSTEIIAEIIRLVDAGVREITLLGQTVDSYRDPLHLLPPAEAAGEGIRRWGRRTLRPEDETEFPALLREIAARVPKLGRLRYTSPHPRHLTPALVSAHRDLDVLAHHVHMPVQSGSDAVLKRMGRRYTVEEYLERTDLLRETVPSLTLSTDIIVGFPGETRAQFEETLALVTRAQFIGAFAFKYSPRPFTSALNFADDVTEEEKSERLAELIFVSETIRSEHLARLVGSEARVLVEGKSKSGAYTGRTERNEIVHFGAQVDLTGQFHTLRLERRLRHSMVGRLLDPALDAPFELPASGKAIEDDGLGPAPAAARAPHEPKRGFTLPVLA
jgi:tRNA-2-methylthio-N6-dimethylallyladenosine synthase